MTITTPAVGERVRLRHDIDRYPHFIARAGATGTITDLGSPAGSYISVRMDEHLPGAEEWDNEVVWPECDDPGRFVEDCVYEDASEPGARHTIVIEMFDGTDESFVEDAATAALENIAGVQVIEYHHEQMTEPSSDDPPPPPLLTPHGEFLRRWHSGQR